MLSSPKKIIRISFTVKILIHILGNDVLKVISVSIVATIDVTALNRVLNPAECSGERPREFIEINESALDFHSQCFPKDLVVYSTVENHSVHLLQEIKSQQGFDLLNRVVV